jgi:hypothetical protein
MAIKSLVPGPAAHPSARLTEARALAPHVQAAIGALVQRRTADPKGARIAVPHVQAALGGSAQPRAAVPTTGKGPAPHVQAAMGPRHPGARQPLVQAKIAVPPPPALTAPLAPAPPATRNAPGVVQRRLITEQDRFEEAGYGPALDKLLTAARSHGQLKQVIDYAEDESNGVDLLFALGRPDALAETDFTIGRTVIATGSDLEKYLQVNGVAKLASERLTIRIVLNAAKLSGDPTRDALQTLAHEYAIHAMKYPSFLFRLRQLAKGRPEEAIEFVRQEYRHGSMSGKAHHQGLIDETDEGYTAMRELLLKSSSSAEQGAFLGAEREDIRGYRMEHEERAKVNTDAIYELMDKTEALSAHQPLLGFKKKVQPPPKDNCCCFLTTACITARGLAEDCPELTTLRAFRDGWMRALPNGDALIERYYEVAPKIVQWIEAQADATAILDGIYHRVVRPTVALIEAGETRAALELYGSAVERLQAAFSTSP